MAKATKKTTAKRLSDNSSAVKADDSGKRSETPFSGNKDASLAELFVSELKDMYWAEKHLVKSIPKMISASSADPLRAALEDHLEVTRGHVSRIEEVFEILGEKIVSKKCDAMEGLVMSGEHAIENTVAGTTIRDTGIISSGLKVENFEITAYNGLINLANALGKNDVATLLGENRSEEQEANDLLTELAEKNLAGK